MGQYSKHSAINVEEHPNRVNTPQQTEMTKARTQSSSEVQYWSHKSTVVHNRKTRHQGTQRSDFNKCRVKVKPAKDKRTYCRKLTSEKPHQWRPSEPIMGMNQTSVTNHPAIMHQAEWEKPMIHCCNKA